MKFWEKIIRLPRVGVLKSAYLESLKNERRDSWLNQVKKILYLCGLSEMWNEGKAQWMKVFQYRRKFSEP